MPTHTVTFFLTDIEGSTRLWEEDSASMDAAIARHDLLAAEIIRRHDGILVKHRGEGDSLFAVFDRAGDAVACALAFQQALGAEPWPGGLALRARVALHTGDAAVRDGDYFGPVVNRCARLRASAHGQQVLLSAATQELVRDQLPDGVTLRDLGDCRLRDLTRPERVFQLLHPALPSDFPPLRTLHSRPNNLPAQPTPLLGREKELAEIGELLRRGTRLVTLTGPGGTGKTRLALQVAADRLDAFEDGAFFVDLAPLRDPGLVVGAIAGALGVRESGGQSLQECLGEHLREKAILLLLDNFEQLLPAAQRVADLLAAAPHLTILVTSREALRLRGEHTYAVPPLALPPLLGDQLRGSTGPSVTEGADLPSFLSQYAAVALFIERAVAVKSDFAVTNDNAPAVAEICHRLDGLPLAIELAAARVRLFSPEALLSRLVGTRRTSSLQLLAGGPRDAPARHQTLRDTIAWSYALLDEGERTLLRRLSIFSGGCSLEAAEGVCDGDLDLLASLVDKSLVRQQEGAEGEPRFTMLETIREFAGEQLVAASEGDAFRERHARCFMELAEEAETWLRKPEQVAWLDRLEREHRNLQAALAWCGERGPAEIGLRLGGALESFWFHRGYWTESYERLAVILALPGAQGRTLVRAKALRTLGSLSNCLSHSVAVRYALYEEALILGRELGDPLATAEALFRLANAIAYQGHYDRAWPLMEESLTLMRALGEREWTAVVLNNLGCVAWGQRRNEEARILYERSRALWIELGNRLETENPVNNLALLAIEEDDLGRARSLLEECEALARERRRPGGVAIARNNLGMVALGERKADVAEPLFRESLTIKREIRWWYGCIWSVEGLAAVAALREQWEEAARRFGAVAAARVALKAIASGLEEKLYDPFRESVRAALGEAAFAAAWAAGKALTLQQAIAEALEEM